MTNFLIRKFIKDYKNTKDTYVRQQYTFLSGITGIILNIVLCLLKFLVGILTKSVSVTADAVNNLSDASSSVISIFGAKLSAKPADEEHPYGHGRMEYIAAFIVASIIMVMGFELLTSSVSKIINPQDVSFSYGALIALILSIPVKLYLAYFNSKIGKAINSLSVKAVVSDSITDAIATFATIISLAVSGLTKYNIDGFVGLVVAIVIMKAGFDIVNEVVTSLMGSVPDIELVKDIEQCVLSHKEVVGVHDMMVHDYGPNITIASLHAEVPAEQDIMVSHDIIDNIEIEVEEKFGVLLTIHLDPVETQNEEVNRLKGIAENVINEIDKSFSIHDFRIVSGTTHTNLLFDVVIPFGYKTSAPEILNIIKTKVKEIDNSLRVVAKIEHGFTGENKA